MKTNRHGFTLVELLIVIVVIAILAAVTLISYNGIQQKAHNAITINTAGAWYKLIMATYSADGQINLGDIQNKNGNQIGICFGDPAEYPEVSGKLKQGECYKHYYTNSKLQAALSKYGDASMKTHAFNTGNGNNYSRGVQYGFAEGEDGVAYLYYDLIGKADCVLPGSFELPDANNPKSTDCRINMTEQFGEQPIDWEWQW